MIDVIALGEMLIDFTPYGLSEDGNYLFQRNAGGGTANLIVSISRLGKSAAFIGKVGRDEFGVFLKDTMDSNKVNIDNLRFSEDVNTTLAFVQLDKNGDRRFSFYRNPGADTTLTADEINFDLIKQARVFQFGSLLMTNEPSRSAVVAATGFAKENGLLIAYDPNLRPSLWKSLQEAKEQMQTGIRLADIVKVSDEELEFITGTKDIDEGIKRLSKQGISIILITLGEKGCIYSYKGGKGKVDAFKVRAVDTTGAGDGFFGAVLSKLSEYELSRIESMDKSDFEKIIRFSCAVGAMVTMKKGGIPAMPTSDEVEKFMAENCEL